jgi:hypothetical protein
MATSGTTNFNLEFTELAEEAWERAGREMRSGYDLRTARRSMNLLTIEFANRGINLWTLESGTQLLTPGIATYNLPTDTIDIIEHVIRTGAGSPTLQSDLTISRISVSTYSSIPAKLTRGRPIQIFVERLRDQPRFTLWPVPDDSVQYTLAYYRLRRIQDAGTGINTPDAPFRFLPAIAAGLAYQIALKIPELAQRVPMLKAEYDEQFNLAAGEDREKASVRFVPRIYGIRS